MRQALDDVRVVELAYEVAGGYCGKVFADLGAEVIKLEPPSGDPLRGRPAAFAAFNLNKVGRTADPATAEGRQEMHDLLDDADLVIETPGAGGLADWGTSRDDVRARRPDVVITSITGFGTTGPYAAYRWSDLVAQTFIGALTATPLGGAPVKVPASSNLCAVGHTAAMGSLGAVLRSRATGEGAHVDCAAYEALGGAPMRSLNHLGYEYRGRVPAPAASLDATNGTLLPLGIFPCADGYVSMMSTLQQLPQMLDVLDDDPLREALSRPDGFVGPETKEVLDAALYPWLLSHTRAEITAIAQRAGWPVTPVLLPGEVLEADHLHQRAFWVDVDDPTVGRLRLPGPLSRHSEGGWQLHRAAPPAGGLGPEEPAPQVRARRPQRVAGDLSPDDPPLRGIRVLDLTTVWSGPYATLLLADLGAEVIRLESPWIFPPTARGYEPRPRTQMVLGSIMNTYGPLVEGRPDRPYNRHVMNNSVNRGKLSCSLDPRSPRGRELFMRLLDQSDVVIENLRIGTMHRMGLHETELLERNPRLVVARLPATGLTGDWARYIGFGAQFDALSGISALTGPFGSDMAETPSSFHMDLVTGPAAAFAVMAALHYRAGTGRGQVVEVSQCENLLHQLGDVFAELQCGTTLGRMGNRDPRMAPQGLYPSADGPLLAVSVVDDEQWAALCHCLGMPEVAADERFTTVEGRIAHHDELDVVLAAWTKERPAAEAFHALQRAGVAAAPGLDDDALLRDPHVAARNWLRPLTGRDVGTHLHVGHVVRGLPLAWERAAPGLGEDNEYVFKDVLGLDDVEYAELIAQKIAVEDYLGPAGEPV